MSLTHNAPQVAGKLYDVMPYVRAQLAHDLEPLAQRVAAAMRLRAPKWRSTLTNSIRSERAGERTSSAACVVPCCWCPAGAQRHGRWMRTRGQHRPRPPPKMPC